MPQWKKPPVGGLFMHPSLWGLASSGHTKAYECKLSKMASNGQPVFQYDTKPACRRGLISCSAIGAQY
jgi:hypothetical protein